MTGHADASRMDAALYAEVWKDRAESDRQAVRARMAERARELRWTAAGRARVVHPKHGSVVVPHQSNFAAMMNAAEYWGCDWTEITGAEVWAAKPGDGPVVKPREFCKRDAS